VKRAKQKSHNKLVRLIRSRLYWTRMRMEKTLRKCRQRRRNEPEQYGPECSRTVWTQRTY
jgi:hypothetical protein